MLLLTNDCADLVIHLCQLFLHVPAVDAIGVTRMVHSQVVCNQHIPAVGAIQQWDQMLQDITCTHTRTHTTPASC